MLDLSYPGREEAEYVLRETRVAMEKAIDVQASIAEHNITPELLRRNLCEYHRGLTLEKAHANIDRMLRRTDGSGGTQRWVPRPYNYIEDDEFFNRKFHPKAFFKEGIASLPPLVRDLKRFVEALERDIDSYPVFDKPDLTAAVYDEETFVAELVAAQHPDITALHEEENRLTERAQHFNELWLEVQEGDWDYRQKEAMKISEGPRRAQSITEAQIHTARRQKLDLARTTWNEREEVATREISNLWQELQDMDSCAESPFSEYESGTDGAWQAQSDASSAQANSELSSLTEDQQADADCTEEPGFVETAVEELWGAAYDEHSSTNITHQTSHSSGDASKQPDNSDGWLQCVVAVLPVPDPGYRSVRDGVGATPGNSIAQRSTRPGRRSRVRTCRRRKLCGRCVEKDE